ncbi:ParB/RepB/Spo0J family partition protein [Dokdonella fugitiva]|jgi:ParB family chromosome partitioning protein|uniref:Probable chromosome-partitioning protein ParB n=1 Tax=Dokdonella fugitiva TaxID=328517 RepID=A0A4R2I9J0_9GAMM|nr:ParB/RepB/Spo0J family partition protein [Dokdonella fugitiva]MBA8885178.1 ParB family chromosome partitioning protein [Dokdonella fugitiva]TCO41103.1 ParB family chromosome partitioning protein [Dokdonella fugitiva]
MAAKKRPSSLGRGLDALLGGGGDAPAATVDTEGELRTLGIHAIQPGKYQPRHHFDAEPLEELAASIKAQGLIQPVVVRAIGADRYELIAGERRWRAAQQAGLGEIPALVKVVPDQAVVAMALIENIQREDLSPLEEAQALSRLIDEFGLTHQQAAEAVGRSRAAVSNLLRLLELPAEIKRLLDDRELEMGHARALATLPEARAVALAHVAVEKRWSVRELEDAVRQSAGDPAKPAKPAAKPDPNIVALERDLAEKLATRVRLAHARNGRGKLVIHYHSLDELDGILERIR